MLKELKINKELSLRMSRVGFRSKDAGFEGSDSNLLAGRTGFTGGHKQSKQQLER